jgi:hypothetical protein
VADLAAWKGLIDRLRTKGAAIFTDCSVSTTEAGPRDPKVVALALLCRSLSSVEATALLLDNDMVVEARTLVRTIYENLFYVAALAVEGAEFVEKLEFDDLHSKKARAGGLLDFAKTQSERSDFYDELEAFRAELIARPEKTYSIKFEQAARSGGVLPGFIVYRELSTDAAHPTAASLSRHIIRSDDLDQPPFSVVGYPELTPADEEDTAELLCSATIGVLVGVNQILGGVDGGDTLEALFDTFKELGASNRAERAISENSAPSA